jgi:predicted dehydrogenase
MKDVWIIGTGPIGLEYAKIVKNLSIPFIAIGRGETNLAIFEKKLEIKALGGGLEAFLNNKPELPSCAIISVGIEALADTTKQLLAYGVNKILVEKPGIASINEIDELVKVASANNATVLLAYNRRFYSSVFEAEKIIKADGEITSFNFEFTEWSHVIEKLDKSKATLENWFLANSSHVLDLAFFLGGKPVQLSSFYKGGTKWHPSGSIYSGAGESDKGALFSYQANWEAPGRWVVEILTKRHRLYLKPMENLQIQEIGSVVVSELEIDDQLDKNFKPGFYLQTKAFIEGDYSRFCTLKEQQENIQNYYLTMSGYKK